MIQVDRARHSKPDWWNDPEFQRFLRSWSDFHRAGGTRATQMRMGTHHSAGQLEIWKRRALPTLLMRFHDKCAYSEEPIDEKTGTVVMHRPEEDAIGLEGDISPEHYWWRVLDWRNWLPVSRRVASIKGTSFPVVGPRLPSRRSLHANRVVLESEAAILLDPWIDHPAWYLGFGANGDVWPREPPFPQARRRFEGVSRGGTMIRILGLDDEALVLARVASLQSVLVLSQPILDLFRTGLNTDEAGLGNALAECSPQSPFAAARRQVLAALVLDALAEGDATAFTDHAQAIGRIVSLVAEEIAAAIACGEAPSTWTARQEDFCGPSTRS